MQIKCCTLCLTEAQTPKAGLVSMHGLLKEMRKVSIPECTYLRSFPVASGEITDFLSVWHCVETSPEGTIRRIKQPPPIFLCNPPSICIIIIIIITYMHVALGRHTL